MSWFSMLISPVTDIVGKWQDRKTMTEEQKLLVTKAKVDSQIRLLEAKATATITQMQNDATAQNDLDIIAVKAQANSWKDEALMVIFLIPFVLAFWPDAQIYIKNGFEFLKDSAPDWYTYIIWGIFISVFGFRRMFMQLIDLRKIK